jgi:alkylation response protein AidB-like acyl-CoA dehydrogenase
MKNRIVRLPRQRPQLALRIIEMKLTLSDEQSAFREEVQLFTGTLTPEPHHQSLQDQFEFLVQFERQLHQAGLAVVSWPEEYGGRGLSALEYAIVCEELGRAQAPEVINFVGLDVIAPALIAFCNPSQLREWLPKMASAEEVWCQLFSEPDYGSDLANLRTRAIERTSGWRVTGQKVWSTWAQFSKLGLLVARTGEVEERHRGISAFVVDMTLPGIEVRPLRTMTGSAEFAEVFFQDVELPRESLLSEVGHGWNVAQVMLAAERGPYAIRRSAVLRGALTGLVQDAAQKRSCNRQRIAEAIIAMELLDLRIRDIVTQLTSGKEIGSESALTKLLLGQVEQTIFSAALGEMGMNGIGFDPARTSDLAWVERYLYSRASTIYGGTAQIQRNIIGERILGLPR